jgi:hypothetical protein
LETFERSVSRFESEYTAAVIYDGDGVGAVRYSFGEPQQPAAVEEIYDGAETISAYEGSVLPPQEIKRPGGNNCEGGNAARWNLRCDHFGAYQCEEEFLLRVWKKAYFSK